MARQPTKRQKITIDFSKAARNELCLAVIWLDLIAEVSEMHMTDLIGVELLGDECVASAGNLVENTGFTAGAVTVAIDRLETMGFVVRGPHPTDNRKVMVWLRPDAIPESYLKLRDDVMREFAPSVANYSDKEFERMTAFTNQVPVLVK